MPEVFVSNHMKQQRNYTHYKRNKNRLGLGEKASKGDAYRAITAPSGQVEENSLVLVTRIKGRNMATTPQAQKILSDLGLRTINNAVFVRADKNHLKKLVQITEYVAYGYPSKKTVNDLIRKRGFLKKDDKKLAITDNVLIEELLGTDALGPMGCICIEDIIDSIWKCKEANIAPIFHGINKVLWPMQLGSLKETIEESNMAHEATGRDVRKKNTKTEKGGYIGFMGPAINDFVKPLI